jgi:hypothetical protein
MSEITDAWAGVDFHRLADTFQGHVNDLIHRVPPGESTLHGRDLHAEALRRTVTAPGSGLESSVQCSRRLASCTVIDRTARRSAEQHAADLAAQLSAARADALAGASSDLDRMMRNPNVTRPMGKFRVEGWLQAASTLAAWARQERGTAAR